MPLLIMIFLLNIFPNQISSNNLFHALIFWNVGQGQWITYITPQNCLHFDMGGEHFPLKKINQLCSHKRNQIYLSHWDWDHIGGIKHIKKHKDWLQSFCIAKLPIYSAKPSKTKLFKDLPLCEQNKSLKNFVAQKNPSESFHFQHRVPEVITTPFDQSIFKKISAKKNIRGNDLSQTFKVDVFLIPGDSPHGPLTASLPLSPNIKVLSLSHHGSRTGTSIELLNKLPNLQMAVASARYVKYRHPHSDVIWALQQKKIPLLRTEDWGNIHFIQK